MKVTIVGLNYKPEVTGIAPYTADAAEGLRERGHDVHVVTGFPHYPEWHADPRYGGASLQEVVDGVPVTRHRHYVPDVMTVKQRTHLETSFGTQVARHGLPPSDVVICVSPALLSTAMVLSRIKLGIRRPATGVWVQDLYSRGVVETGMVTGPGAAATTTLESQILKAADGVAVIHDRFRAHVVGPLGLDPSTVDVIPNWTHLHSEFLMDRDQARDLLGWPRDRVIALHAGNMGLKQGLENVVEAARLSSDVEFILLGDGNQRHALELAGRGISTLKFVKTLPEKEFRAALCAADALIVNERPNVAEMAVPSKLTSYFGSGVPVVAATAAGSVTHSEVDRAGAGVRVDPDDPWAMVTAIKDLAADRIRSSMLGDAGLDYMSREMSRDVAIDRLDEWVHHLVSLHRHGHRHLHLHRGRVSTAASAGFGLKSDLTRP